MNKKPFKTHAYTKHWRQQLLADFSGRKVVDGLDSLCLHKTFKTAIYMKHTDEVMSARTRSPQRLRAMRESKLAPGVSPGGLFSSDNSLMPAAFVLYLDFDGVLHPHPVWVTKNGPRLGAEHRAEGHTLFEHTALLEQALAPFPFVQVVLATTWAQYGGGFSYAKKKLPPTLQERVIGCTFHAKHMDRREFQAAPRGLQIWSDVLRRQPRDWLALDDDAFGWPAWCRDKLLRTDETLGISAPGVIDALTRQLRAAEEALRSG
ncbi:hypothetical protein D3C71_328520 [compost metagenome]